MRSLRPLVIATNREPHKLLKSSSGKQRLQQTAGGLVSALAPALAANHGAWFAWNPNAELDERALRQRIDHDLTLIEVSKEEIEGYYSGFANGTLWPLCHYALDRCRFRREDWSRYVDVNRRFADRLAESGSADRLIWVHDYHLMLVPRFIRARRGRSPRIAYFHHIPFPAADLFRVLPWHRDLLYGLLGADLVGLHTSEYVHNFLDACARLPDVQVDFARRRIVYDGHTTHVGAYPIGIDVEEFVSISDDVRIGQKAAAIREQLGVEKLLLGVDRLDYTKGIQQRLAAVDRLLTKHRSLRGSLSFVQIAAPSRTDVPAYKTFKRDLDALVGRINGKHAQSGWQPVHCIYRTYGRRALVAYYRAADVALVTPLRDGMNLVAKEFCAARTDNDGVLVLSEFAGAAEVLGSGALVVNPFDTEGFADTIGSALALGPEERARRMRVLRAAVAGNDVHEWLRKFLADANAMPEPVSRVEQPEWKSDRIR